MNDYLTPQFTAEHYLRIAFFLDKFALLMRASPPLADMMETENQMLAAVDALRVQCLAAAANGVVYTFGFLEGNYHCGIGYSGSHPLLGFKYTPPEGPEQMPCHIVFRDAATVRDFVKNLSMKLEQWLSIIPPEADGLH